jgi:hypothetical protein
MAETIPLRSRLGIDRDRVVKTLRVAEVAVVNHTVLQGLPVKHRHFRLIQRETALLDG